MSDKKEKEEIFFKSLNYQFLTAESAMKICNFAKEKGEKELILKGLEIAEQKFKEKSFSHFRVTKLIFMIENFEIYKKDFLILLQQTISDHRSSNFVLEEKDRIRLYQKLWNLSISFFNHSSFSIQDSSTLWFERCSSLLSSDEYFEKAKCYRLISSIKIKIKNNLIL